MSWTSIVETYKKKGVVLCLGAGVSVGSNLPNWPDLLQRLADGCGDATLDVAALVRLGWTLPAIAGMLARTYGSRDDFAKAVRRALYQDFPFFPQGVTKENRRAFVRHVREQNSSLSAVAALCACRLDSGRYAPNPLIHGIVTFNLDVLLQAYVYSRYEKRLLRTVERAAAGRLPGKIPVYHMHGNLRFDSKAGDPSKEGADVLVLGEHDYFDFFNDPLSLFNYTFMYLLREYICLFIGFSMTDTNARRLLHYSRKERIKARVAEGCELSKAEAKALRHFAVLERPAENQFRQHWEDSLKALGVTPLWLANYSELTDKLGALYCSTGSVWQDVY